VGSKQSVHVALSARACAKINLTLRLTGRRPDGYHDLRTVLQSLALHDTLRFRATRGEFRIECDHPACPTDRANLVWRAAELVWRAAGRRGLPRDVVVTIEKRIPLQAGLGGGSSDAAAAIRGLSRVWHLDLSRDRQHALAATLGADVPFFLEGGTALGLERGDLLFPLVDLAAAWVTLVIPPFGVSTKDAYRWWDSMKRGRTPFLRAASEKGVRPLFDDRLSMSGSGFADSLALSLSTGERRNDLEEPVVAHHPEIDRMVRALRRQGAAYAAMSGSGSAVFGLFEWQAAAERAARLSASSGCRTLVTRTVSRADYRRVSAPR
jgi:4-diphosphocytidyl-2-C-methyl-D-erythritol kinase